MSLHLASYATSTPPKAARGLVFAAAILLASAIASDADSPKKTLDLNVPVPAGASSAPNAPKTLHISVPMPETMVRAIIPVSDAPSNADFNWLIDHAAIERWDKEIELYIHVAAEADRALVKNAADRQLRPFLQKIAEASGQSFRSVAALGNANALLVFSPRPADALVALKPDILRRWFGAGDADFKSIEKAFATASADCFRFVRVEDYRIVRSIAFMSTRLGQAEQDKCIARNSLYTVGLRGELDGTDSSGAAGTPANELGLLDQFALGILYGKDSQPGVVLRQTMKE